MVGLSESGGVGRPLLIPFKVLVSLIYGEFSFLERELPLVVVPTGAFCRQLSIIPNQFKVSLEYLEQAELIESYQWHRYHATIRLRIPKGLSINVGEGVQGDNQPTSA